MIYADGSSISPKNIRAQLDRNMKDIKEKRHFLDRAEAELKAAEARYCKAARRNDTEAMYYASVKHQNARAIAAQLRADINKLTAERGEILYATREDN